MTTLTIMRALPREVDPVVFNMLSEDPGKVIGCLRWGGCVLLLLFVVFVWLRAVVFDRRPRLPFEERER